MKKVLLLIMLVMTTFLAKAGNVVTLSSVQGEPGDVVTVEVALQNTDAVSGMQMSIPLDKYLTYVNGSATLSNRASDLQVAANSSDGKLDLVVFALGTGKQVNAGEGTVVSFQLKLGRMPGTYPLAPTVLLSDSNGNNVPCSVTNGAVKILAPQIATTASTVDWGRCIITKGPYNKTVTIQNTGTAALNVTGIEFDNPDFSVADQAFTIAAGGSKTVTIAYSPINYAWGLTATMVIKSDAINGDKTVKLTAVPYSVNELSIKSASGNCDDIVEIPVNVKNMEPLVGAQFSITLPAQLDYVEGSFTTAERTAALTATSTVSGKKVTMMLYSFTNATMTGNDGVIGIFKVKLNGKSGSYRLTPADVSLSNVKMENMTSASSYGTVTIQSPIYSGNTTLNMGTSDITQTATATYNVKNTGKVPLKIEKIAFLDEGFSITDELPISIAVNQTKSFTVNYKPSKEGPYSTTMNVYTNDPDKRMVSVKVSGDVYEPDALTLTGEAGSDRKSYTLKVGMDNYTTNLVALQFDVHWTAEMKFDKATATERWKNQHITAVPLDETTWRVVAYTLPSTAITGNSGELMSLDFVCDAEGAYNNTTVKIDSIMVSNARGEEKSSVQQLQMTIIQKALGIKLNKNSLTIAESQQETLNAEVLPEDTANKAIVWESNNEDVATVSQDGVVTALKTGTATITAKTTDGSELSASCELKVVLLGDVNLDGNVDIADVNSIVNIILTRVPLNAFDRRDDINGNGVTDIADVNACVNIILKR